VNKFDVTSHEQARELLPWLVNDSLAANERTLVREHAKNCVICRKELAELELDRPPGRSRSRHLTCEASMLESMR
jgi:hypothetical protein